MIYLVSFLECFCNGLLGINSALYMAEVLHLNPTSIGHMMLFSSVLSGICIITLSPVIDKVGVKKPLLVGSLLLIISRFIMGYAPSIPIALLSIILVSIGSGLKSSSVLVYIKQTGKSFKLDYVIFNFAYMLSGVAYDWIRAPDRVYLVAATITCVNLIVIYFLPNIKRELPKKLAPYSWDIAKRVLVYNIVMTPVACIFAFLNNPFPSIILKLFGPDAPVGKLYGSLNPLIIFIVVPLLALYNKHTKTHNPYKAAIIGTFISSLSLLLVFLPFSGYIPVLIAICVFTIGEAIWSPSNMEIGTTMCPDGQEGRYMTLALLPKIFSNSMMSLFAAYALNHLPGYTSFLYIFFLAIITPLCLLLEKR